MDKSYFLLAFEQGLGVSKQISTLPVVNLLSSRIQIIIIGLVVEVSQSYARLPIDKCNAIWRLCMVVYYIVQSPSSPKECALKDLIEILMQETLD